MIGYLIIISIIVFLLLSNNNKEHFYYPSYWNNWNNWSYWNYSWPWNQPTRFPKLYYDIRGDPNIVYRKHIFGVSPYGYLFGPYLYDSQGNLLHDTTKPYYVA